MRCDQYLYYHTRTVSQTVTLFPKLETIQQVWGKEQGFGEAFTKQYV